MAFDSANRPPKPDIVVEDDPKPEKFKNVPLGRFAHDGEQVVEDVDFTPAEGDKDSLSKEKKRKKESPEDVKEARLQEIIKEIESEWEEKNGPMERQLSESEIERLQAEARAKGEEWNGATTVMTDKGRDFYFDFDGGGANSVPRKAEKILKERFPEYAEGDGADKEKTESISATLETAEEATPKKKEKRTRKEPSPALGPDTALSDAFDDADTIIAFFEDRKELKHVREAFESAREKYLNASEEEEAEALLAYEQAQDDVQHTIIEMLNAGAGYHNNIDRNPALYTKGKVQEVFARDFIETKERRAREAGERGPTGDREIDALLKNFKGEFGVLEQQFVNARKVYLEATKKKREKIKGGGHAQNIRLSGKEARFRDLYLSARNDLLLALSNMTRAGAGYTKTSAEEIRGQTLRHEEVSTDKVLDVLIEHEQDKLGEDDESTFEAYNRLERNILKEIKRSNENSLMVFESKERKVQRASDKMARNEPLLVFGETVGKRRATFAEEAKKRPIQKGLSSKRGFFSSLFSVVFGTPRGNRR